MIIEGVLSAPPSASASQRALLLPRRENKPFSSSSTTGTVPRLSKHGRGKNIRITAATGKPGDTGRPVWDPEKRGLITGDWGDGGKFAAQRGNSSSRPPLGQVSGLLLKRPYFCHTYFSPRDGGVSQLWKKTRQKPFGPV